MRKKSLTLLLVSLFSLVLGGCSKEEEQTPERQPVDVILKDAYKDYFTIGAAYRQAVFNCGLEKHFNSLTAENEMKWYSVHPHIGQYTYDEADKYIEFAKQNKMQVRGHALVWHEKEAMPEEFLRDKTKDEVLAIEKDHIQNVVTHFKDDVYCWDVCNEVIDDGVTPLKEDKSNVYRTSDWYNICGKEFISTAFIEADKVLRELGIRDKVKLFYNDYDNTKPVKKAKTLEMLHWLIDSGVPIDGIGLQSHYHLGCYNPYELEQAILDYSALGLDIQITEFDVDIYDRNYSIDQLPRFESYYDDGVEDYIKIEATIYDSAFKIFRKYKDKISNVTFWGVYDGVCYMQELERLGRKVNFPFVFDVQKECKPAFYRITDFGEYKGNYPYNYYGNRGEALNSYSGDGQDLHLSRFYPSHDNCMTIEEGDSSTKVTYSILEGYAHMYTEVTGMCSDFNYINIKARGTPGRSITFRLFVENYQNQEDEQYNILGKDVSFSFDEGNKVYSLKMKSTMQTRLDLLKKVAIYPEIGQTGVDLRGEFTFEDLWFSKELPEGADLKNPGVDSGDTSVSVNGWKAEGWTMYTLYPLGSGKTGVRYNAAADWASIERDVEVAPTDKSLIFAFENKLISKKQSVTCMHMFLKGDVKQHINAGDIVDGKVVEYEYDIFYEQEIYSYDISPEHVDKEVQPDENNITTLQISIEMAYMKLKNHMENGLKLMLRLESTPDDYTKYRRSRDGDMVIHSVNLSPDKVEVDAYSQYGGNSYVFNDKDGMNRNITYTNISRKSYAKIARAIDTDNTTHDTIITVKIRNNGTEYVRCCIHAGVYLDEERSDDQNSLFYPLWEIHEPMKNADGYFTDGQTNDIQPGETLTVSIFVNSSLATPEDKIDVIQFLFDSCRGEMPNPDDPSYDPIAEPDPKEKYSGDIDIVSIQYSLA